MLRSEPPGTIVVNTTDMDVVLGRGKNANARHGNVNFRRLVTKISQKHEGADSAIRGQLANQIVAKIHSDGGRFLQAVTAANSYGQMVAAWEVVTKEKALSKAKQSLRDAGTARKKRFAANRQSQTRRSASEEQHGEISSSPSDERQDPPAMPIEATSSAQIPESRFSTSQQQQIRSLMPTPGMQHHIHHLNLSNSLLPPSTFGLQPSSFDRMPQQTQSLSSMSTHAFLDHYQRSRLQHQHEPLPTYRQQNLQEILMQLERLDPPTTQHTSVSLPPRPHNHSPLSETLSSVTRKTAPASSPEDSSDPLEPLSAEQLMQQQDLYLARRWSEPPSLLSLHQQRQWGLAPSSFSGGCNSSASQGYLSPLDALVTSALNDEDDDEPSPIVPSMTYAAPSPVDFHHLAPPEPINYRSAPIAAAAADGSSAKARQANDIIEDDNISFSSLDLPSDSSSPGESNKKYPSEPHTHGLVHIGDDHFNDDGSLTETDDDSAFGTKRRSV